MVAIKIPNKIGNYKDPKQVYDYEAVTGLDVYSRVGTYILYKYVFS